MKKALFSVLILVCLVIIIAGADFRRLPLLDPRPSHGCTGYTIIEFDKGIDCKGDTIKLVRPHGYAERALKMQR